MPILAAVAFSLLLPQGPPAPTRDEKIQAVATLGRIWTSYADPKSPHKQMVGMGIVGLLQDLAGTSPMDPPAEQQKKLEPILAELKKSSIDVSGPVESLLVEFRRFECQSKQSEARGNLKGLYVGEEAYRAEFDTYDKDPKKIGFKPRGEKQRYRYEIQSADKEKFKARAVGIGEMAGDEWTITQDNDLQNTKSLCPAG